MKFKQSKYLIIRALYDFISYAPISILLINLGSLIQLLSISTGLILLIPLSQLAGVEFNFQSHSTWGFLVDIANWLNSFEFTQNLAGILCAYLFLTIITAFLSGLRSIASVKIQQGFINHTRMKIYNLLISAKWQYISSIRSAEFIHRLGSQAQNMSSVANQTISLFHKILSMLVYTALMFALNWKFTALTLLCGVIAGLIVFPIRWSVRKAGEQRLINFQEIFKTISEHLGNFKLIKSSGKEWQFEQNLQEISNTLENQQYKLAKANTFVSFTNQIALAFGFATILYFSVNSLNIPIANFFLLMVIMSRLMPQIAGLQQSVQQISFALPNYADIEKTIKDCENMQERAITKSDNKRTCFKDKIEFKNVSFAYPDSSKQLLIDFNIRINAGSTLAIIGNSGIGKTTFADLLSGLLYPSSGEILVDDTPLEPQTIGQWRRSVAYVTQETFLFNDSVRNNLKWINPAVSDNDLWDNLKKVGLKECVEGLADGLDSIIGDRGSKLSGGERQRLAIARALVADPDLLILDESTNALDSNNEDLIRQTLKMLHRELTIVIISHRFSTIKNADYFLEIESGKYSLLSPEQFKERFPS